MPQRVNPDIVRYYSARMVEMQKQLDALRFHISQIDAFANQQSRMPLSAQYRSIFRSTMARAREDANREADRLRQEINSLRLKIGQWNQRPQQTR